MIIKYINFNYSKQLDNETLDRVKKHTHCSDDDFFLKKNEFYSVYAVTFRNESIWVHVCLDKDNDLESYPIELFNVIDTRLSRYWQFNTELIAHKKDSYSRLVFKEWAESECFYEDLIDGDDYAKKIFADYKQKMDLEFASPLINNYAKSLDDDWLMCETCDEVWENKEYLDELIVCPNKYCQSIYLNQKTMNKI